jgi:hypothetical protein
MSAICRVLASLWECDLNGEKASINTIMAENKKKDLANIVDSVTAVNYESI